MPAAGLMILCAGTAGAPGVTMLPRRDHDRHRAAIAVAGQPRVVPAAAPQ